MSKPDAISAHSIPTGILVSAPAKVCHAERPPPQRKAVPPRDRPIPWLWIVTLGSIAWAALILVIGISNSGKPSDPQPAAATVHAAVSSKQATLEPPVSPVEEPIDDMEPMPAAEPPKLAIREPQFARFDEARRPFISKRFPRRRFSRKSRQPPRRRRRSDFGKMSISASMPVASRSAPMSCSSRIRSKPSKRRGRKRSSSSWSTCPATLKTRSLPETTRMRSV